MVSQELEELRKQIKITLSYQPRVVIGVAALSSIKVVFAQQLLLLKELYRDIIEDVFFALAKPIDIARDQLISTFLTNYPYATHLWILDDDVLVSADALATLLNDDLQIVSGLLVQKTPPYYPLMTIRVAPAAYRFIITWDEKQPLLRCSSVGFGCMLIRRDVPQIIPPPWAQTTTQSEDYSFCSKAEMYNIPIYVDQRVQCGHIGEYIYSINDFKRYQQVEVDKVKSMGVKLTPD